MRPDLRRNMRMSPARFAIGQGHPLIGSDCPACHEPIEIGAQLALIPLGPGNDPDERRKAWDGSPYNAVALAVHYACATGEPGPGG